MDLFRSSTRCWIFHDGFVVKAHPDRRASCRLKCRWDRVLTVRNGDVRFIQNFGVISSLDIACNTISFMINNIHNIQFTWYIYIYIYYDIHMLCYIHIYIDRRFICAIIPPDGRVAWKSWTSPLFIKCRSNAKSWYDEHVHDVYDI